MKQNLLVTLADKNYIQQAKQLFSSVYWNAGWKGDYMLLSHEIPEKDLKWFRDKGILIKKCKPLYDKMIGLYYPPVVLDKFYLFTPEFKKWKNIIFLDADIIVRASLDEPANVTGLASPSPPGQKLRFYFFPDGDGEFQMLNKNYNLDIPPLNSATMFFNTDIITEDTFDKLITLFKKHKRIAFGDDPIINLFFYKRWANFPSVYNVYIDYFPKNPPKKAIIFHFGIGVNKLTKPWDKENIFYNEWKNNLGKAEFIDLTKIPEGKKWTKLEIYSYSLYLKIKIYISLTSQKIFIHLKNTPDRLIGQIGLLIKRFSPNLYYKLKKIKDG